MRRRGDRDSSLQMYFIRLERRSRDGDEEVDVEMSPFPGPAEKLKTIDQSIEMSGVK